MKRVRSYSSTGSNGVDEDSLVYPGTSPPKASRRPVKLMRAREWRARAQADLQRAQNRDIILDSDPEEDDFISPCPRESYSPGQTVPEGIGSEETVECAEKEKPVRTPSTLVAPTRQGLINVRVQFGGRNVVATINTGAAHNTIAEDLAKELGLSVSSNLTLMPTKVADAEGALEWVEAAMEVGPWKGRCSLVVQPLDDFQIMLGVNFCSKAKIVIVPHLPGIMILGYGDSGIIRACTDAKGRKAQA